MKGNRKREQTVLALNETNLIFLGAKYSPSKGNLTWPDDTEVVYNAWNPGEPRFGLDCSLMVNRKGWGTDRCDMERSYICKKGGEGYYNLKVHGCLHFEPQGAMPSLDFQYKGKSILRSCVGSPISL